MQTLEQLLEQFVAVVLPWLLALLALFGLAGCQVSTNKDANIGFRFGTEVAIFHNSPDTVPEEKASTEFNLLPPVWDLIDQSIEDKDAAPAPTASGSNMAGQPTGVSAVPVGNGS